ncbi:MAG: ergothioneine biosynthesis protein EgtC [Propionibacteriales bacterium]|nr:ergothioneine biosynthesis protein EgtC [Propionibacteriales bacterium]
MCRHVAYLGPPIPIADLVIDAPHSLVEQSYAPLDMRGGGRINADGFGIGWHPENGGAIARYRRSLPIWSDASLPSLARMSRSGAFLAAVRSATVGMPVVETASAPFTDGHWLFSHNGFVPGWPASLGELAATVPVTELMTLDAPSDSALIWVLVLRRLAAGAEPVEAVVSVVHDIESVAPGSRLNLLLLDQEQIVATTVTHSLSVRHGDGAVVVSSEPLTGESEWHPVADRQVVVATPSRVQISPLEG